MGVSIMEKGRTNYSYNGKVYLSMEGLNADNTAFDSDTPVIISNEGRFEIKYFTETNGVRILKFLRANDGDFHISVYDSEYEDKCELVIKSDKDIKVYNFFKTFIEDSRLKLEAKNVGMQILKNDKGEYEGFDYDLENYIFEKREEALTKVRELKKVYNHNPMGYAMNLQLQDINSIVFTCDDTPKEETPKFTFIFDENCVVITSEIQKKSKKNARIRAANYGHNRGVGLTEGSELIDAVNGYAKDMLKEQEDKTNIEL